MDPALAYDSLAPFYDRFTADYEHEAVLGQIETLALAHGLRGRRLLDVACGTGKSFLPLRERGYDVTACDVSPEMVRQARRKLPFAQRRRVVVADMRALAWRDQFDLVTCLDDAVNYLLTPVDLRAALGAIGAALRAGGLAVFDVNSLRTYRETFCEEVVFRAGPTVFAWRGEGSPQAGPGGLSRASVRLRDAGGRELATSHHVQRHHPRADVEAACASGGMPVVAVRGVAPGGHLEAGADETRHRKLVYLAARKAATGRAARR